MTPKNAELNINSTIFDWRLKSKRKSQKKWNKRDIWKWKFVSITQNLTFYQKKISSITISVTSTKAELNGELNGIWLNIQIEAKIAKENKQKRHLGVKICLNHTKFHNFTRYNSLNWNSNDTHKCRIEWWVWRYSVEDSNRSDNTRRKERKKTFGRENLS